MGVQRVVLGRCRNGCVLRRVLRVPARRGRLDGFVPYRDQHGQEPDTLIRAFTDTWTWGEAVAQVKGENYTLGHIRDFRTAMQNVEADLGVFVVTTPPTRGMLTEATRAGTYRYPFLDLEIPVLQIYEIQNHFRGIPPRLPFGERAVL